MLSFVHFHDRKSLKEGTFAYVSYSTPPTN
ncbi:hypothetical protein NC651_006702 [Populus alba x Populus x berolinensis]|nr:hypothetical protein NC651_006702 [Populus alba x Populus x berolinensis]